MKRTAKNKSPRKQLVHRKTATPKAQEKAALRSQAFERASFEARSSIADPARLRILFEEASRKAAAVPKKAFRDSWPYIQAMLRLIRAYVRGEYRNVSEDALLSIVSAMNYFIDPFDLIPDEIPFLGFVDDATVISLAVTRTRRTLDDFMIWETAAV
jgi:uncharacterized membrane protein YkvA (DUF1232 family)